MAPTAEPVFGHCHQIFDVCLESLSEQSSCVQETGGSLYRTWRDFVLRIHSRRPEWMFFAQDMYCSGMALGLKACSIFVLVMQRQPA